jgi:prevent-host-death family protein
MKRVSITEAKNKLSALIDGLKNGSSVLIMDRGRPVARLEPVSDISGKDARAELIRRGVLRPRRLPPDPKLFKKELPRCEEGGSVLQALLEERRSGR